MPGATFWVLAISALALIVFVSGPVAEEYPLAAGGILAFMFVQVAFPACRIRTTAPVCPANIAQGYYWIQLVLVTVLVGYFGFSQGVLPHLPPKELSWRLHFIMGALSYTLAGTDALKLIAELAPTDAGNDEILLRRLAPFLLAGLESPLPAASAAGRALDGELERC